MQKLTDYSDNLKSVYVSNAVLTSNLCSLASQVLTKDSNYIYSADVKISGSSFSLLRLFRLSNIANQIIFSQNKGSLGAGVSVETDANGYLFVKINGTQKFGTKKLIANTVYVVSLAYTDSLLKLNINNELFEAAYSGNVMLSSENMKINMDGDSGVIFVTDIVYDDINDMVSKVYYLSTHYRIYANVGTLSAPVKGSYVGIEASFSGDIPNSTSQFVYDIISNTFSINIKDGNIFNNVLKLVGDKHISLNLSSLVEYEETNTSNLIFSNNTYLILFSTTKALKLDFVNPSSGRVLGYTREVVDSTHWNHRFYVDDKEVDAQLNNANEFVNSKLCDIPLGVSGSQLTISPSEYILDDLIIDDKKYVKDQIRSYFLADELVDDLNEKTIIAPVKGFSNSIIYSVESTSLPTELQPLADANKEVTKIVKYSAD